MDDLVFHQCVNLPTFIKSKIISFIPPDGEFELINYRLYTKVKTLILVECLKNKKSWDRIEYKLTAKSKFKRCSKASSVVISIPIPAKAKNPKYKSDYGVVQYFPELYEIQWFIKNFQGEKEFSMNISLDFSYVSNYNEIKANTLPISVRFEIPYFTVSGIQLRYLKVRDVSGYKSLPWVRYMTRSDKYKIYKNIENNF